MKGYPQPVATVRHASGASSEFVEGFLLIRPRTPDDLQRFAAATDWAWELTGSRAEFHPDSIQRRATVEFRWKGSLVRSTFVQDTDWIASEFVSFVLDFARAELPGVFIKLPFVDQVQAFLYIERAAEADILTLMTETPPAINFRKSGEVR